MQSLGKRIKGEQANSLLINGLNFQELCRIRAAHVDDEEFKKVLQERGVRSFKLRETLTTAVPKTQV